MLDKIINDECVTLELNAETVLKLITKIDLLKIEGQIGGMASSKFGDYLGFLRLPDTQVMQEFFARRWADHFVRITVPKAYMKYLPGDVPLFTPPRLEPVYSRVPFYQAGIEKTETGVNTNPHNHGTVRKPRPYSESSEAFIIAEFVPVHFYLELPNETIATVLMEGLPAVNEEAPYPLHMTAEEARAGLSKHLHNVSHHIVSKSDLMRHTLVTIAVDKLDITSDNFYTNSGLEAGSTRAGGYYFVDKIPAAAIKVADENIT